MTAQTLRASAPTPFHFHALTVRVVADDQGDPWFCAPDVCTVLGYANDTATIKKHCREGGVAKRYLTDSLGREQETTFIGEGNLYRLIIKSKKPEAEKFEAWVCDEVLPAIRKHGRYEAPQTSPYTLTREQHAELLRRAQSIAGSFWFKDVAKRALVDRLHSVLGVKCLKHIPANAFERALEILAEVEMSVRQYVKARYKEEMRIIETSIRPRRNAVPHSGNSREAHT